MAKVIGNVRSPNTLYKSLITSFIDKLFEVVDRFDLHSI